MLYPVWVNGVEDGRVHPSDRGLAFGDGLFETMRVEQGRVVLLQEHLERLTVGAAALAIPLEPAVVRDRLPAFLATCPAECVAKIIVTRGVSGRGYLPDPLATPTVIFSAHPLPAVPAAHAESGIRAAVCALRLAEQPALAGHKHLNRLEQVLL
ncbi:MAG TPA: aminotransferase class IV, partial [Moraxellaceae bacterium]|nr:aminotransferase class IV [Moraxellaceae bacterium]